jgi:hypothetical protein
MAIDVLQIMNVFTAKMNGKKWKYIFIFKREK